MTVDLAELRTLADTTDSLLTFFAYDQLGHGENLMDRCTRIGSNSAWGSDHRHELHAILKQVAAARSAVPVLCDEVERLHTTIQRAAVEARNVLPDLDDDQATAVERFAALLLR